MSYWRSEYDDGWWTFYKDGIEIKLDNPNFGDLIVDEINNANKRIAELEEANKYWSKRALIGKRWIPVSERLPDNWESVLTIDISKSTRDMVTAFYNPETSRWSTHSACDLWVTHWMPLPEPPIMYGKVCEE